MALDLNDKTTNGNNLTNTGTVAEYTTNFPFVASTEAVEFSTTGQSLNANDSASLDLTTAVTIEFWAKRDSGVSPVMYYLSKVGTDGTNYAVSEYNNDGKMRFHYTSADGVTTHIWVSNSTYTDAGWHHWAFVCTFGTEASMLMYYDGSSIARTLTGGTGTAAVDSCDGKLVVGNYTTTGSYGLDGKMDEVRIWSDIRTATEISDNKSILLTGSEAGLVAYWPFQGLITTSIKKVEGVAYASIKKISGVAIASVKKVAGVA